MDDLFNPQDIPQADSSQVLFDTRLTDVPVSGHGRCRCCGTPLSETFADLGMTPMANAFVRPEEAAAAEPYYPLHALVCERCHLVQLGVFESPEAIFGDYLYFSSYSQSWLKHAETYAARMAARFTLGPGSQTVEVASNDGYLLQYFAALGIGVLGVDPAANVAAVARAKGIPTEVAFFGAATARRLRAQGVSPNLMTANNVLAHVPDLHDFVEGFRVLLAPGGVATFEFPHLLRLMRHNQFDTIYHEHFSYLSLMVVERVFAMHGLAVFDVEELPTHGGSLRVFARHAGDDALHPVQPAGRSECFAIASGDFGEAETPMRSVPKGSRSDPPEARAAERPHAASGIALAMPEEAAARVAAVRAAEAAAGLGDLAAYRRFAREVADSKCALLDFLIGARRRGERVAAYGAPAKGNTLLNYCGVGPELIAFTVDRNPHKQGLLLPGTRIPIRAPSAIAAEKPDHVLILPWNLRDEIAGEMAYIRDWGGRFVVPIPSVEVF